MRAKSPLHAIELIDRAFEAADIETLADLYDENAVFLPSATNPGMEFRGREAIKAFYQGLLQPDKFKIEHSKTHVIEADGVALFTSRWTLRSESMELKDIIATVVFRQKPDGSWKDLIDSGPAVLDS